MRRELFRLKINVATAHVKDYSEFKKGRRNIARVLTFCAKRLRCECTMRMFHGK